MEASTAIRDYRAVWDRKPVLRLMYDDFHDRIAAASVPGVTIEVGGGVGNLKERLKAVFSTDIQCSPRLDCITDAQCLPFAPSAVSNIVMVDVLHHLEFLSAFFREAGRVLRPGGRLVMVEPAITWGSTLFYRLLHQEPVRRSVDIFVDGRRDPERDPYDANQAIPTLLVTRDRARFGALFPNLKILNVSWFSLWAYPLSGGFKTWSLVSESVARRLLRVERVLEGALGPLLAFRIIVVIERTEVAEAGTTLRGIAVSHRRPVGPRT
jgi:SAM-dependent methyltransferase